MVYSQDCKPSGLIYICCFCTNGLDVTLFHLTLFMLASPSSSMPSTFQNYHLPELETKSSKFRIWFVVGFAVLPSLCPHSAPCVFSLLLLCALSSLPAVHCILIIASSSSLPQRWLHHCHILSLIAITIATMCLPTDITNILPQSSSLPLDCHLIIESTLFRLFMSP